MKITVIFILAVFLSLFIYRYYSRTLNDNKYIAVVDGEGITRQEYDKEVERVKKFYLWSKQDYNRIASISAQDILDHMIEDKIVAVYAKKKGIFVKPSETQERYNAIVGDNEKEYLEKLSAMYGTGKDDFLKKVEKDILSEKVQKLIGQSLKTWITEEKMNYKITIF